ncbi:hypothetical protein U1Q18_033071 [Sarracenia purpurea var. burkii]
MVVLPRTTFLGSFHLLLHSEHRISGQRRKDEPLLQRTTSLLTSATTRNLLAYLSCFAIAGPPPPAHPSISTSALPPSAPSAPPPSSSPNHVTTTVPIPLSGHSDYHYRNPPLFPSKSELLSLGPLIFSFIESIDSVDRDGRMNPCSSAPPPSSLRRPPKTPAPTSLASSSLDHRLQRIHPSQRWHYHRLHPARHRRPPHQSMRPPPCQYHCPVTPTTITATLPCFLPNRVILSLSLGCY